LTNAGRAGFVGYDGGNWGFCAALEAISGHLRMTHLLHIPVPTAKIPHNVATENVLMIAIQQAFPMPVLEMERKRSFHKEAHGS
jgi:hypothetical protein